MAHKSHASARRLRVLVCPDKFKGSATAVEVAQAIRRGWLRKRPADEVILLPVSDGGDGFGELLGEHLGATAVRTRSVDAAHRPCAVKWWWEPRSRTAIIESARVIGLAMLPKGVFHPFELDTEGLGHVLRAAAARNPRRCIIGVGGSATNDGGFGVSSALGWHFEDARGRKIETWTKMHEARKLVPPSRMPDLGETIVAVDVANPLLGPSGCSRIYGPQKGLRPVDLAGAERNLKRLAALVSSSLGRDVAGLAGAGAAGGLGFGIAAFCGARIEPGFKLFADTVDLQRHLRTADVLITGEGSIDDSTFMGKGVGQLLELSKTNRCPCLGVGGRVSRAAARFFASAISLTDIAGEDEALRRTKLWLARAGGELALRVSGCDLRADSHCAKVSR